MAHVLVVEQNDSFAKLISHHLAQEGVVVSHFGQAEDAWRALQFQEFDLAIIDSTLPGMNGRQLISRIRQHRRHRAMPLLLVTGEFRDIDVAEYMHEYDLAGAFAKPVSLSMLTAAVLDNLPARSAS